MKAIKPEYPREILPKHKLIALSALYAKQEFMNDKEVESTTVSAHVNKKHLRSLVKELQEVGFKVVAVCAGRKCRWSAKGVDLETNKDREIELSPNDAYSLESDILILDEVREYIGKDDVKSINSQIIVEVGNFITHDAKRALQKRGVQIIPHQFFELYPTEAQRPKKMKAYERELEQELKSAAVAAKKHHTSLEDAFNKILSGKSS